jgi:hypothetical protein
MPQRRLQTRRGTGICRLARRPSVERLRTRCHPVSSVGRCASTRWAGYAAALQCQSAGGVLVETARAATPFRDYPPRITAQNYCSGRVIDPQSNPVSVIDGPNVGNA